jgi:hypothetical protein
MLSSIVKIFKSDFSLLEIKIYKKKHKTILLNICCGAMCGVSEA